MSEIEMKVFLLARESVLVTHEPSKAVIIAANEKQAREIANRESGVEGYVWTDGLQTTCKLIGKATEDANDGLVTFGFGE